MAPKLVRSCVFCKIVKGKISAYKIYEDDNYLAFLDVQQVTPGKSLVIPKKHYRWAYEVDNFGDFFETARRIGLATKKALGAKWFTFMTWGLDAHHAHIHVTPRYKLNVQPSDDDDEKNYANPSDKEKEDMVIKIKTKLG